MRRSACARDDLTGNGALRQENLRSNPGSLEALRTKLFIVNCIRSAGARAFRHTYKHHVPGRPFHADSGRFPCSLCSKERPLLRVPTGTRSELSYTQLKIYRAAGAKPSHPSPYVFSLPTAVARCQAFTIDTTGATVQLIARRAILTYDKTPRPTLLTTPTPYHPFTHTSARAFVSHLPFPCRQP